MKIYKSGYILSADRSGCFLRKRSRVERVKKPSLAKLAPRRLEGGGTSRMASTTA